MTNNLKLSSAEILSLWNVYLTETMTTYVKEYFLAKAKDKEVIKMSTHSLKGLPNKMSTLKHQWFIQII
jgi:hypothetical protein